MLLEFRIQPSQVFKLLIKFHILYRRVRHWEDKRKIIDKDKSLLLVFNHSCYNKL